MNTLGVACLGHNIPRMVREGANLMCGVRLQNTRERSVYFQSHASFYGTPISETRHHLSVHVNGVLATPVLVPNDCLRPGERATAYFPLHAHAAGDYRVQLMIAEQHADPVSRSGAPLFETHLRVTAGRGEADLRGRVRRGLFRLRHAELPIRLKRLQRYVYKMRLAAWRGAAASRREMLARYKDCNRQLAVMERQVRWKRVASLPCYLAIDTTSRCNLECQMCFRSHVDVDYNAMPDLPAEMLERLIAELFPTAITLNLSTLGEPLMSPYIDRILEACAAYRVYLSITTNGTVMGGDDFVQRLASVLHYIEISVDSVTPERFQAFRSGASYHKVLHNARRLGALRRALPEPKFNLGFSMTLFRDNLEEIPEVLRVVADVGGNFLKTDIGVVFSQGELSRSVLSCPERYNEIYAIAQEQARAAGLGLLMRALFSGIPLARPVKYGLCDYLYVSACVRSDGTLSPCYFGPASLPVKRTFTSAWNSDVMRRLRRDHDGAQGHASCQSCYVFTDGGSSLESRREQFLKGDARGAVGAKAGGSLPLKAD